MQQLDVDMLSDENFRVNVSSKIFYIHPIENFLTFNISRRSLLLTGGSPDFTNGNRCPSPEWPTIEYYKIEYYKIDDRVLQKWWEFIHLPSKFVQWEVQSV